MSSAKAIGDRGHPSSHQHPPIEALEPRLSGADAFAHTHPNPSAVSFVGCQNQRSAALEKPSRDAVVESIRQRYNGQWSPFGGFKGQVNAEELRNGELLVELSDDLAAFAFHKTPKSTEKVQYRPAQGGAKWLNYFQREGVSLKSGLSCDDLGNDPFVKFKARFTVDSNGGVRAFGDRSAATSKAANGDYNCWETGERDFHRRSVGNHVSSIGGSDGGPLGAFDGCIRGPASPTPEPTECNQFSGSANAYASSNPADTPRFDLQISGDVAGAIYERLNVRSTRKSMGPWIQHHLKYGEQLWCTKFETGGFKCRISFDAAGTALQPART